MEQLTVASTLFQLTDGSWVFQFEEESHQPWRQCILGPGDHVAILRAGRFFAGHVDQREGIWYFLPNDHTQASFALSNEMSIEMTLSQERITACQIAPDYPIQEG